VIAWKTWRDIRLLVLLYVFLLEAGVLLAVQLWPWLRDEAPNIARLAPAEFIRRWVDGIVQPDADAAYRAYMALQVFFKGANVLGICFAAVFGALLIAAERENQTLEFLLSRPVSRRRLLNTRLGVMAAALVLPIFATSWSAIPLGWLIDERLPFAEVTLASAYASSFCVMFLTLTAVCSTRFRTQLHVAALVGGVAVFQLLLYFIQEVRVVSLFRLSDYDVYGPILAGNLGLWELFATRAAWILLVAVGAWAAAARMLEKAEL
jgi:ABC-type transport system involved in multi-copper enzyme maturation permease subunit